VIGVNFAEVRELDGWIRRRMRLYYWKQWKRPRTRRRKLLRLGIGRHEVHLASRSRKGPWRMSRNSIINRALSVAWLRRQGVPSLEEQWIAIRYPNGPKDRHGDRWRIGTARCGAACRVVWGAGVKTPRLPDYGVLASVLSGFTIPLMSIMYI